MPTLYKSDLAAITASVVVPVPAPDSEIVIQIDRPFTDAEISEVLAVADALSASRAGDALAVVVQYKNAAAMASKLAAMFKDTPVLWSL